MRKPSIIPLAALIGLFLISCGSNEQTLERQSPAIPVIATTPNMRDITEYLESIGNLKASVSIDIRPQSSGTLSEILIEEGQMIKQGDSLFKIDPQSYQIRVLEAEAQFAIDQAGLKAIQKKMARYKDLADRDLVAKTEWDDLKAQLQKAQTAVDLDSARVAFAKLDLEHCTVLSPLDGRAGVVDASIGILVASGQAAPLVTVCKMDPLVVEFTVTEKEFLLLPKDTIPITIQSLCSDASEKCQTGTVTFLDNHFDTKTGLLLVKGKIENKDLNLRPGQSVRVKIPIAVTANAKLIPQKAIRYNQQGPYVYVVNEDMTVAIRQLTLGKEHGTDQIVLEGLDPHERIILEGHLRLSPGLKVEIKS